ncbi:glycosyltransferase [Candidatus Venteria ishoeyi]|uniref:Glycosyltransferase Gtf1 n=1 Tax=Candidatus Venteria ishoeyi TaxID=1899563 RepID=A0A1H6FFV3_9GAMM|nr:glycosyltransferase [Candidatus Venteria ishoeyi]SEH08281.1 Glycosyltransferase Gtf1 [Candidatus Venteria ishoeyi]
MKIAFFSRSFGVRGTAGTYLLIDKLSKKFDYMFFTPIHSNEHKYQVYSSDIKITPIKELFPDDIKDSIVNPLSEFSPDIIYIFNFPEWYKLVSFLKKFIPNAKYILDIQTPLLIADKRREDIQFNGIKYQHDLDAIATLAFKSVETWIPNYETYTIEYPLGVDLDFIKPLPILKDIKNCKKFVHIASLHPLRQTSVLIKAFHDFSQCSTNPVKLDIFGDGPDIENLKSLVEQLQASKHVSLKGLCEQGKLFNLLPKYDAGIAWVPYEHYDESPSLKILEFMAAGIPVFASDTTAHKLLKKEGFSINYFSNTHDNIIKTLLVATQKGEAKKNLLNNLDLIKKYDYEYIAEQYHVKLFRQLLNNEDLELNEKNKKLRLILLSDSLALGKGGAEKISVELANSMAARGHIVYLIYQNKGKPAYIPNKDVKLFSYENIDNSLRKKLLAIDPDVFFVFYFNRQLIKYFSLVYNSNIPFGMQECTNPIRLCGNNWKEKDSVTACWEREIIASAAASIRLVMSGYKNSFENYIKPRVYAFPNSTFPQHGKVIDRSKNRKK